MNTYFFSRTYFSVLLLLAVTLSSCGIAGIHLNVYNPKKPGAYPGETRQRTLLGADSRYRNCFDVYYYGLSVDLDPGKKFISGAVVIRSKAVADIDTLQLDLYKNMALRGITCRGAELRFSREEGAVFVQMPATIKRGEVFELTVTFEGAPQKAKRPPWDGGFVWEKDKDGNPWIGIACESEGSSSWWPGKDMMTDEADSADVRITVPQGLMAVSNGVLKDSATVSSKSTYHWHISYPINNYNITLYAGNLKLLRDYYVSISSDTIRLNHYVLPYNYEKAKTHFQQLKPYLAFYEEKFGSYPWKRDGFKLVESPYAGMEHQSAIAYGNGYKNDFEDIIDYIILHEAAHEWWGNSVTAADLADAWIHEGFASYCEALYIERIQGHKAYLEYMYGQRISIGNKRPVVRKRGIRYFDYHDGDIYTKGSWILHTLRTVIDNDSTFFDILKTFRMDNDQRQIFSETFIDLVNKKTGRDYNWFFKQYLFRREAPVLEYAWNNNNLYFRWLNVDDDFAMPVKIRVSDKTIIIHPTTKLHMIKLSNMYPHFYDNSDEEYFGLKHNKKIEKEYFNNIP